MVHEALDLSENARVEEVREGDVAEPGTGAGGVVVVGLAVGVDVSCPGGVEGVPAGMEVVRWCIIMEV